MFDNIVSDWIITCCNWNFGNVAFILFMWIYWERYWTVHGTKRNIGYGFLYCLGFGFSFGFCFQYVSILVLVLINVLVLVLVIAMKFFIFLFSKFCITSSPLFPGDANRIWTGKWNPRNLIIIEEGIGIQESCIKIRKNNWER